MQLLQNESFLEIDSSELAKRQKLDQAEKAGIALTLSAIAQNRAPSEDVDLHYTTVPCISGTTFDHAIEYARVALLKMLKTDDFLFLQTFTRFQRTQLYTWMNMQDCLFRIKAPGAI